MSNSSVFEEFIALLERVRTTAKDCPERVVTFFDQSKEISETVVALNRFLRDTDFERRVFYGRDKIIDRAPPRFQEQWDDYDRRWAPAFSLLTLQSLFPETKLDYAPKSVGAKLAPDPPDPETDETFDPLWHDGGAAFELGIEQLETEAQFVTDERVSNSCRLALGAYDYLTETIGLNLSDVFRRWRQAPVVLMPTHVSNRYGASDKGSLPNLLNDAVRAYVFGAPAAAFAICRAAFEMILKRHYGGGEWEDPREKLAKVVALANERGFIKRDEIKPLIDRADGILHRCAEEAVVSAEDERTILIFLATLKSLIEQAPTA